MSEEEIQFETEKYKFRVYKFPKAEDLVRIDITPKPFRNLSQVAEDVIDMLGNTGKWENLIKAGRSLLEDLGIV